MATTDPITGATINDQGDGAAGGYQIGQVVASLRSFLTGRFGTDAARDTAFTDASVAVVDGMMAWAAGRLTLRTGGTWRPAADLFVANFAARPTTNRLVGQRLRFLDRPQLVVVWDGRVWVQEGLNADVSAAPDGSVVTAQTGTAAASVSGGGGTFFFALGKPFSAVPLFAGAVIGDNTGPANAQFAPGASSGTNLYFTSYQPGGAAVATGTAIRVTWTAVGYNT